MKLLAFTLCVVLTPVLAQAQDQPAAPRPMMHMSGPRPAPPPSSPADGAVVDGAPASVSIGLPHPMKVIAIELLDEVGQTIDLNFKPTGEVTPVAQTALPTLAPGKYEVRWKATMASGGLMTGMLHFSVR